LSRALFGHHGAHAFAAQSGGSSSSGGANSCSAPNNGVSSVFQQILDKIADKAIPASPWKPVSGIVNCVQNYFNDVTQQVNNQFNHEGPNPNAAANMASCMQGVIDSMSNPF
jgi:hypothetical protein